jgi:hypothetical protein
MDLKEVDGDEGMEWIDAPQDRDSLKCLTQK